MSSFANEEQARQPKPGAPGKSAESQFSLGPPTVEDKEEVLSPELEAKLAQMELEEAEAHGHSHNGQPCHGHGHGHGGHPEIDFPEEKRDAVHGFLTTLITRLGDESLATELQTACKTSDTAEGRVPIVQGVLTGIYDTLWIETVEPENTSGAEARLVNALEVFVNGQQDAEMLKAYRAFRFAEETLFLETVHGKEQYEALKKKEDEIEAYATSMQKEYEAIAKEGPKGIQKLNELAKLLIPKVQLFQDKMEAMSPEEREKYGPTMSLEEIGPMIQFRTVQGILGQLAGGGAHGHSHGGKPCGGHGHSH